MGDLESVFRLIDSGGTLAVFVLITVGWIRGWIVSGRQYEQANEERMRLLEMALRGVLIARRGATVAERAVDSVEAAG